MPARRKAEKLARYLISQGSDPTVVADVVARFLKSERAKEVERVYNLTRIHACNTYEASYVHSF